MKQLCGISDGRHNDPRGRAAAGYLPGTGKADDGCRQVHQGVYGRIHKGKNYQYLQLCLDEFIICPAEPGLLINLPDTGFDHPYAGDVLLHDSVDPVQLGLEPWEKRVGFPKAERQNPYGDLVAMSIETYEEMLETAAVDAAISEAEAEFAHDGKLHDAREALSSLKRKHFG